MRAARQAAAQSDETDGAGGDWLQGRGDCIVLSLHVQPGAKTTAVAGLHGAALKIRLAAPPVDGKANACLLAYLAELLGVPKSVVELVSGHRSRSKRVAVRGIGLDAVRRRIAGEPV